MASAHISDYTQTSPARTSQNTPKATGAFSPSRVAQANRMGGHVEWRDGRQFIAVRGQFDSPNRAAQYVLQDRAWWSPSRRWLDGGKSQNVGGSRLTNMPELCHHRAGHACRGGSMDQGALEYDRLQKARWGTGMENRPKGKRGE